MRACFCCHCKVVAFVLLMKQCRILSQLSKDCKYKSVCVDKKQNQIIKNHEIWNGCGVGVWARWRSSPKVIDFSKANFEGKQNAPGVFACNPVMNGKSTPHK